MEIPDPIKVTTQANQMMQEYAQETELSGAEHGAVFPVHGYDFKKTF